MGKQCGSSEAIAISASQRPPRLAGLLPREARKSDDGHGPGWSVMVAAASFPSTDSMVTGRTSGDGLVTSSRYGPILAEATLQPILDVLTNNRR
jgi:hypothetical protein